MGFKEYVYIGLIFVLLTALLHYTSFSKSQVCGYDGRTYSNIYAADAAGKWVQSYGQCIQVDIVTITNAATQKNPVASASIPEKIGMGLYQIVSYLPYKLVL